MLCSHFPIWSFSKQWRPLLGFRSYNHYSKILLIYAPPLPHLQSVHKLQLLLMGLWTERQPGDSGDRMGPGLRTQILMYSDTPTLRHVFTHMPGGGESLTSQPRMGLIHTPVHMCYSNSSAFPKPSLYSLTGKY